MTPESFCDLFSLIKYKLAKQNTDMRSVLPLKLKFDITIRYLVTGNTSTDL